MTKAKERGFKQLKRLANSGSHREFLQSSQDRKKTGSKLEKNKKGFVKADNLLRKIDHKRHNADKDGAQNGPMRNNLTASNKQNRKQKPAEPEKATKRKTQALRTSQSRQSQRSRNDTHN